MPMTVPMSPVSKPAASRVCCLAAALAASLAAGGCATAPDGTGVASGMTSSVTSSIVGPGWAGNSINTVAFRQNALVSDGVHQYVAYYDQEGYVVLGKRRIGSDAWHVVRTDLTGDVRDAHNAISIMVDGAGYLHLAWNHHDVGLHYARGVAPGSLALRRANMVGRDEGSVSYPQFFRMPDGGLLFFYRDGSSGQGNLVLNRYDPARGWTRAADNLIGGEGRRNAYWQACVDGAGTVHVSWVWRESPDVASNHDMAYARSRDGGGTWEDSTGRPYRLPITAASAEYAAHIPQGRELINQTSMAADAAGHPYIASYWREGDDPVPQYRVLVHDGAAWRRLDLDFRTLPFTLGGVGTKAVPIARPQLLVAQDGGAAPSGVLVFRDRERSDRVSAVRIADFRTGRWRVADLDDAPVGAWEPTLDTELWRRRGELNLFVQPVDQVDGEGLARVPPSTVRVLQWRPGASLP